MAELLTYFPTGTGHFLAGGLLIGLGVGLLYVTTGLVGGMSSVFSSTWSYFSGRPCFRQARYLKSRDWRLVYAAGLIIGATAYRYLVAGGAPFVTTVPWPVLLAGGFLVGLGARLGHGCTSGHGICGLASLQWPSLAAVLTFLATGILTAHLVQRLGGG